MTHIIQIKRVQRALLKVTFFEPRLHLTDKFFAESRLLTVKHLLIMATVLKQNALTHLSNKPARIKIALKLDMF